MPTPNAITPPDFPKDPAAVPVSARINETFGWMPACWAFGLMVFSTLVFTQPAKPTRTEYIGAAISLVLGVLLLIYELRRRKNPRVLARFPQSNQIGLYKRGTLNRTVNVESVNLVLYHPSRTWGPIMALAMISLAFAVFLLPGPIGISLTDRVYAALASLLFAFCTASVIKTRLRCDTCMFPYQNRRGSEWIMVRRKAIPLLLGRAPIPEHDMRPS